MRARVVVLAFVALALAACTSQPDPSTSPTHAPTPQPTTTSPPPPQPDSSVGPLVATALTVAQGTDPGDAEGQSLNLPQGWTAEVWANVPGARLAAWSTDGKLLVSTGKGGTVEILTPTSDGQAPKHETLLVGLSTPQGVAFALNGKVLVVGEHDRIVTYDYDAGAVSNRQVIVDNLPTGGHDAKGVAVNGDTIYYSLGSSGNRVPRDRDADPQRATVWQVSVNGDGNSIVATGVRNGMALAIAPDKTLFTGVNQMDNQPYPFDDDTGNYGHAIPDYVDENPIEQVTRLTQGADLGWPFCVPDTTNTPNLLDVPFVNDPEYNADGANLDCTSIPNTMLGLPAHSAPLGLSFTAGTPLETALGSGALITTHGSWNRTTPREPGVAFSPWDSATNTLGAAFTLVTGFQSDAGDRWGRSVDAVPGPDGSLYVTDDAAGLVYRITPGE